MKDLGDQERNGFPLIPSQISLSGTKKSQGLGFNWVKRPIPTVHKFFKMHAH